jgi:mono/diheme cytochrome c family protein
MKKSLFLLVLVAVCLCVVLPQPGFAQDGGALYKAKCAGCHGPGGEGKVGPKLQGTSMTADQIAALITTGDAAKKVPHKKPLSGVSGDDAKAIAAFVKTLK